MRRSPAAKARACWLPGAGTAARKPEGGVSPTSTPDALEVFKTVRPRLTGLAYRITGSFADAEDVVQEAWIRWAARHTASVDNPAGWLTTVTSRLASTGSGPASTPGGLRRSVASRAGSHRRRREETAEVADSLTLGFLVLLDSLGPSEAVLRSY